MHLLRGRDRLDGSGRLPPIGTPPITEPATMPWGNRSPLFRDPDGNLVNFFTPVTRPPSFAR